MTNPFRFTMLRSEALSLGWADVPPEGVLSGDVLRDESGRTFRFVAVDDSSGMVWRAYNGANEWAAMHARCKEFNR